MKTFLLFFSLLLPFSAFTQSVTIAPTNPANPTKGTVVFNNGTNQLQYWNGTNWIPITNAASGTGWALSGSDIYNSNAGRVLIGAGSFASSAKFNIITPAGTYGLLHAGTNNMNIASYVGTSSGFFGTTSTHPFTLMANNGTQLTILPNGNIGLGNTNPANKLQVGSVGSSGFAGNDFAFGNGTNATAFYQSNSSVQIGTTQDLAILTRQFSGGQGYVGINTPTPSNKLQIGSMGSTGYSTNDFALGNGTEGFAIYQTNTETQLGASKNIILKPTFGSGMVGINTLTPRAPLDVATTSNTTALSSFYSLLFYGSCCNNDNFTPSVNTPTGSQVSGVSIVASGLIYAHSFGAYSDSRIKNSKGISNSSNDLETVNALKITDYTMKDVVMYGNRPFKKVIAQEVEKVYPQVISKHRDFVPNVYQPCSDIEKMSSGYLLRFHKPHQISKTAKKLRLLISDEKGMEQVEIVGIPTDHSVIVNIADIKGNRCFVYGEEVEDFRTVDYEGLTTLTISATQELSKLVSKLQDENAVLQSKNDDLTVAMEELKKKNEFQIDHLKAEMANLKALFLNNEAGKQADKK